MHSFLPKFSAGLVLASVIYLTGFYAASQQNSEAVYSSPEIRTEVQSADDRPIRTLRDFNNAFIEIAENASPTVVTVFTERKVTVRQQNPFDIFEEFFGRPRNQPREREYRQEGQGSGVIVSADGYILTNHHVIANAETINIRTLDNRTLQAEVVGSDSGTDIAVLKVEGRNMPHIQFGDSDELRVGEWVMAIGSPLSENLAHSVTQGIVSAKGRSDFNLASYEDFIQTDAAINPGNSGGPLLNVDGQLIGINTAIASRSGGFQGIGFAIPVNMAKSVMESLIETGRVVRGYIGLVGQDIDETMARALEMEEASGIIVSQIVEDAPGYKAGLRENDIILEANGQPVRSYTSFRNYVASKAPGSRLELKINRDGNIRNITVTLGEFPDEEIVEGGPEILLDRFGFAVDDLNRERAEAYGLRSNMNGALVTMIEQASNAYRQGLREGDLIIAVNRARVNDVSEFNRLAQNISSGDTVLLQVIRRNQRMYVAFDIN